MACLYILYSADIDRFYIGSTKGEPEERLRRHLSAHKGYTARAKDWKICFTKTFDSYTDAIAMERQLKRFKSRKYLLELIGNHTD